ncbi:MAG TPA: hypothetical protein VFY15_02520 [Acidimicrobiia bacterium]|nr:hypothetical protein [Acidimicrobiia bacterium]
MRRVTGLIGMLLLVAACGGDSATSTTVAATTTTAAVTTTTTAPGTTTVDEVAARVAAAEALAGDYTGEWHNLTFGSTGSIAATLTVDQGGGFALLTIDLGGNVFGASDPDPFLVELDLVTGGPYSGTSDLLGDYTVEVQPDGHVVITAPDVPGLGLEVVIETDITEGEVVGTYDIPGLANGEFTATRG